MITEREWASIREMTMVLVKQIAGEKGNLITGEVIKRDESNQLVWISELGDQPIPVVAFDPAVKYYDEEITSIIASALATPSLIGTATPTVTNRPPTRQIFTSGSGTYTRPANCLAILVECIGGGGGGGGAATVAGGCGAAGGGGGGAYAALLIQNPLASYAYTVGGGGNGGAAGANSGNSGTDTTFGTTVVVAKAGGGGTGLTALAVFPASYGNINGIGGLASGSTGEIKLDGGRGPAPAAINATVLTLGPDGGKGAGPYGGAGATGRVNAGASGNAIGPGGGGAGATIINGSASTAGGNGAPGIIVITEFYNTDVAVAVSIGGTVDVAVTATPTTQVTPKQAVTALSVPEIGDHVLVALELGSQSLPRCVGVIQGRNWIIPEDEG